MDMEFGDILTGKAGRTGKESDKTAVQHSSIRCPELAQNRRTRLNHAAGDRFDYKSSLRAGNTQHGNAGRKPAARQCNDRIA
ncbi:hypothetical protein MesoLj113a_09320 [Mesorhizobium sp. 113-1-2]|nr:Transcription factor [Mesorhizobium loti]BCG69774.1 hypothetical protein MesoLj113a_09320 [Mesorhizobium sp. 113-1-2]